VESDPVKTGSYHRAFIPIWKQDPGYWTGVVASNFGDSSFTLDLVARDHEGSTELLGRNPASVPIEPGLQKSLLGSEFFESDPWKSALSWIELGAEGTNRMGSIFLFGTSGTRMMDGAEAQSAYAGRLYFTRARDEAFLEEWNPETLMSIVNPTGEAVTINCILNGPDGTAESSHTIPPGGFICGDTAYLVGSGHGIDDGYVEIEVTSGPGVIGFSRIDFPEIKTALGINAARTASSRTLYSAQLAHGMDILTNLRLVNTSSTARKVTLTAIGDDGDYLADPVTREIAGKGIYSSDLGSLFNLAKEGAVTTGSLAIEADGHGIIGDIIFADGKDLEYAMSLPLQEKLFTEAVFNHISNLPSVFTGFAFFNPGEESAEITLEAIGTNGDIVAVKNLILGPGERIARTLRDPDVWPDFPFQSGGYMKILSTRPIAGQQLFGDKSLRYMAAVPPTTRIEPMFN